MNDRYLQFEALCARCEPVLEQLLQAVHERRAPDASLARHGAELLDSLCSAVQAIREETQPLPDDQVHLLARDALRIHSDDPYYAQAFAPLAARARSVLDFPSASPDTPLPADPALYELLVSVCQAGQPLPHSMLLRLEQFADVLPRPVLIGLLNGKYRLEAPAASEPVTVPQPVAMPDPVAVPEPVVVPEPVTAPEPVAPAALPEAEAAPAPAPADEADDEPAGPVRCIHPIRPIQPLRLPTEQALEELFQATSPVMARLLDKLAFLGLMDMAHLHAYLQRYPTDTIDRAVSLLELRGYIATYAWQGRAIICFTPQMKACLLKRSLHETLRRLLRGKPLVRILRTASQDMPQDDFLQHLQRVDLHHAFISALWKHPAILPLLPASSYSDEAGFSMTLRLEGIPDQALALTRSSLLPSTVPAQGMGLISCADALPDMDGVTDDCRFCLTPDGLHQWRDGSWTFIVS